MSLFNIDENMIYIVIGIICLTFVLIAIIKFPQSRWFVGTILSIALVISAIYSAMQLNVYYQEFGGIYGQLTGFLNTNNVIVEDLSFDFRDVVLTEVKAPDGETSYYEAKFTINKVLDLSREKEYGVYVNGSPVEIVSSASDYIVAEYEYLFMDKDLNILCSDTLNLSFAFYKNSTTFVVSTHGGENAVNYWNYYFNKNSFIVEINELGVKL